jgi:hypothetical protein
MTSDDFPLTMGAPHDRSATRLSRAFQVLPDGAVVITVIMAGPESTDYVDVPISRQLLMRMAEASRVHHGIQVDQHPGSGS